MSRSKRPGESGRIGCRDKGRGLCECSCRPCGFSYHCGSHLAGCHQACRAAGTVAHAFRRFEAWRRRPGGGQPRRVFQGVVFSNGVCVIEWTTRHESTSRWPSFRVMMDCHGHSETEIRWLDADPGGEPEVITAPSRAAADTLPR
jgi:hypothetical protein